MNGSPVVVATSPRVHAAEVGAIEGLSRRFPEERTLEMFRKICVSRTFEFEAAKAYNAGAIKIPIYLSVGQEQIPAAVSTAAPGLKIFAQHRAHSYYLSFGADMHALIDELLHRPTGCARGMGGSASIHSPAIGMYGHSGLMGDQVPIAVGAALGFGCKVLTVVGDASVEEDYVWSAMGYAASKRLPVLLLCEDNNLSILTPVSARRTWSIVELAKAMGIPAVEIGDDPWLIAHHVADLSERLPAVINVHTCRNLWHAGTGNDGAPLWDRFALIKDELKRLGLEAKAERVEAEASELVTKTWQAHLAKP